MSKAIAKKKVIVTTGDYALAAGGESLWDCPTCTQGGRKHRYIYKGNVGQLVAWIIDPATNKPETIAAADIATAEGPVYLGQFIDTTGGHTANNVRLIAGRSLSLCSKFRTEVVAPECKQPQVLLSVIDCAECGDVVQARFQYSDNQTQGFGKLRNDEEVISASTVVECNDCKDCDADANMDKAIGDLVDELNGEVDFKLNDRHYPLYSGNLDVAKPYRFFKAQENYFVYCIGKNAPGSECEDCDTVGDITEITVNGNTHTLVGTTNAAGDATYEDQLENVAWQIECAFKEEYKGNNAGTAFVTGYDQGCDCQLQLHVITCDAAFAVTGLTPCTDPVIDLTEAFQNAGLQTVRNCASGACEEPASVSKEFCHGIGVIIRQDSMDCIECDIDRPPAWYGRVGEFTFIQHDCQEVRAREVLCPKLPVQTGGEVRWEEFAQDPDGEFYRQTSERLGWNNSLSRDRAGRFAKAAMFSKCNKSYCKFVLDADFSADEVVGRGYRKVRNITDIYIPTDHAATLASFEEFYHAYIDALETKCQVVGKVTCAQAIAAL